jgi:ribosomal protein S18 acetylase RimI-like enzyme
MKFEIIKKDELHKNIKNYIHLIEGWKYSNWKEENFMYELPAKWEFSFSVTIDEKLAAFCIASNKIKDAYYIHLLFISKNLRGKSIGKEMINYAKGLAIKNKISKMELRCPESNKDALSFYLKNGFVVTNEIMDETSGNEMDYYLLNQF